MLSIEVMRSNKIYHDNYQSNYEIERSRSRGTVSKTDVSARHQAKELAPSHPFVKQFQSRNDRVFSSSTYLLRNFGLRCIPHGETFWWSFQDCCVLGAFKLRLLNFRYGVAGESMFRLSQKSVDLLISHLFHHVGCKTMVQH